MAIGEFKQQVTFKNPTKVADGAGGYSESYATLLSTWASVKDASGSRYFLNAEGGMSKKKVVRVFYRDELYDALSEETIVVYNGEEYTIDYYTLINETKKIIRFDVSAA
jgi:SPP1 family predicted phage head-tail adaptor